MTVRIRPPELQIDLLAVTWLDPRTFTMSVRERTREQRWFGLRTIITERSVTYIFRLGIRKWLDNQNCWLMPNDPKAMRLTELLSGWWAQRSFDRVIGIEPLGPLYDY